VERHVKSAARLLRRGCAAHVIAAAARRVAEVPLLSFRRHRPAETRHAPPRRSGGAARSGCGNGTLGSPSNGRPAAYEPPGRRTVRRLVMAAVRYGRTGVRYGHIAVRYGRTAVAYAASGSTSWSWGHGFLVLRCINLLSSIIHVISIDGHWDSWALGISITETKLVLEVRAREMKITMSNVFIHDFDPV